MLQAAQRSNKTGVWKVGDLHIKDLLGSNVGDKITLTSEDDFNTEFDQWFDAFSGLDLIELAIGPDAF
jgi:hypothetical protein